MHAVGSYFNQFGLRIVLACQLPLLGRVGDQDMRRRSGRKCQHLQVRSYLFHFRLADFVDLR